MNNKIITIVKADGSGKILRVPRINFESDPGKHAFHFVRRQFPLRLCYGITSNKAQGQTMERAGIYMPPNYFSHGQLYVAMSRVGDGRKIKVLHETGTIKGREGVYTDNVVYPEVL